MSEERGDRKSERRLSIRYAAGGLEGRLPGNRSVDIVDLSTGGFAIATSERLRLDHNYTVNLRYRSREIEFPTRVAWSRLATTRRLDSGDVVPWYLVGLELRAPLGAEGRELLAEIQHLAVTTLPQRIHARARLQPRAAPGSERWCNIEVTRLSQKGLSCELGTEPMPFIELDIELPVEGRTIELRGRLTAPAERDSEIPGLYRAGIEFLRTSSLSRKALADHMAAQLAGLRPQVGSL